VNGGIIVQKVMKIVATVLGALAVAVACGAAFIGLDWPVLAPVQAVSIVVAATPERLVRGKKLVSIRCAGCHYDQKTGALSGHVMVDAPPELGTIYSHNITRHPTRGIGRYSDGELVYLLRTGVRRDGVFTGPFMQSPHLADEDLYSIIAFLRSEDPWTEPKDVEDRQWQPTFLAKLLMHVAFAPMQMPVAAVAAPNPADPVALGRYIANAVGDCYACHSADFKTLDTHTPEKSEGYYGGGNRTLDSTGRVVATANLTMDPETGLGRWSEAEFITAVRTGFRPDGRVLRFPMTPFFELTDQEVASVFTYLKTLPAIANPVARRFEQFTASASADEGERHYTKYGCFSCHGNAGVGVCDLREARRTYDTDEKLAAFIRDPSAFVPNTKMPTWNGVIAESEYVALIAHVRALERRAAGASTR
jgi:mono/diheme cytochrome c family protein